MPPLAVPSTTRVFEQAPREALRAYVRRLLVVEFGAPREDSHLPETGLIAAFPFRGECRLEDGRKAECAVVTGLCDHLRHHAHGRGSAVVVAAFTPLGAAAFLRQPLDPLANSSVALEALIGRGSALVRLDEQLAAAPNALRRVRLVEDFLSGALRTAALPDPLISAAVAWLQQAPPQARIEDLVRHIGLSQSALERRFRRVVGASPKRFASLLRLKTVLRLHAAGGSLTSIAHESGYFDQAHFIHDFQRFTGLAPEAYFARTAPGRPYRL